MPHWSISGVFAAACLLLPAPVLCETAPAAPAPTAAASATQILLQHTIPTELLKTMHWDQAGTLPAGVSRVTAQPADNALSVVATPAGLAKVREIVAILDIAPRQVEIKSALATATDAQLEVSGIDFALVPVNGSQSATGLAPAYVQYATGKSVTALLASLMKSGAILQQPVITTTNNTAASINLSTMFPENKLEESSLQVTPRLNSDNSVTLALNVSLARNVVAEAIRPIELTALLTVKNGETRVMGEKMPSGKTLLLFVTPTVLPAK